MTYNLEGHPIHEGNFLDFTMSYATDTINTAYVILLMDYILKTGKEVQPKDHYGRQIESLKNLGILPLSDTQIKQFNEKGIL